MVKLHYLKAPFANKLQQRFLHPVKQVLNEFQVFLIKSFGKSAEPRYKKRFPSEHVRLHVNHTTTTHLKTHRRRLFNNAKTIR